MNRICGLDILLHQCKLPPFDHGRRMSLFLGEIHIRGFRGKGTLCLQLPLKEFKKKIMILCLRRENDQINVVER